VLEWIFKADKFSNYHNTPDSDRVEISSMHFEKSGSTLVSDVTEDRSCTTWTTLTRALESQFGPSPFDCPMAELFKLQKMGQYRIII